MQAGAGLTAPEAQALQIRELGMLLADARHQVESYRRQLTLRNVPAEEMAIEIKRLKVRCGGAAGWVGGAPVRAARARR